MSNYVNSSPLIEKSNLYGILYQRGEIMKDVFDKTEGKLYEELKELSFQMMLNETNKLQIENNCHLEVVNAHKYSHYTAQERIEKKEKDLLLADKEGFALSLAFDELLLSNGYKFNAFKSGPNAVKI